jgi:lysophospholipase L1-like esterase
VRILIFGDSIAQGYYDLASGGWANLLFIDGLKQKVRRTDNTSEIFNLGVSGDTIRGVRERLESELEARRWEDEPFVLIFAIGFNDTRFDDNTPYSTPLKFQSELEALHQTASKYSNKIVYVGLTSVDEAESAPWQFNTGNQNIIWTNERIALFDAVIKDIASSHAATYVPLLDTFLEKQKTIPLHADGIHPNDAGHQLIFERVSQAIKHLGK